MSNILCIFALWIVGGHVPTTRGDVCPLPLYHIADGFIKADDMAKKKDFGVLIRQCRETHKNKYDYSYIKEDDYVNNRSLLNIICPIHGVFSQRASNHLRGQGCPACSRINVQTKNTGNTRKRPRLVWGIGINDYEKNIKSNHVHIPSYHRWEQMLKRCYSKDYHAKNPTYSDCRVCDEWLRFSNFKKWFDENYVEGYALDKDILVKGNKVYSPDTCCFVSNEINVLLCKSDAKRGRIPIGVYKRKLVNGSSYMAYLNKNGSRINLGTFYSVEDAFKAYKKAKELHIQEMATQYFNGGKITEKVYNALMNYKVEITD